MRARVQRSRVEVFRVFALEDAPEVGVKEKKIRVEPFTPTTMRVDYYLTSRKEWRIAGLSLFDDPPSACQLVGNSARREPKWAFEIAEKHMPVMTGTLR